MFLKIIGIIAIYELLKTKENVEELVDKARELLKNEKDQS